MVKMGHTRSLKDIPNSRESRCQSGSAIGLPKTATAITKWEWLVHG